MEVTNERLLTGARNLKKKGYTPEQVDAWLQSKGSSLDSIKSFAAQQKLPQITNEQKAQIAQNIANYENPSLTKRLKDAAGVGIAATGGFAEGVDNALNRMANAATLGGLNKLSELTGGNEYKNAQKIRQRNADAGLGVADTIAGLAVELPANIATVGSALYNGLGKLGAKGLGQLIGSAAIEGGAGNAIQSDSLRDILPNAAVGTITGAALSAIPAGAAKGYGFLRRVFRPNRGATQRALKYISEVSGGDEKVADAAADAMARGRSALEVGNTGMAQAADQARIGSPEANHALDEYINAQRAAKADTNRQAIDYVFGSRTKAQNTDDIIERTKAVASPIYERLNKIGDLQYANVPQATRYKGADKTSVLKSIRRNMEKTEPDFSMAKTPEGRIDYPHFLKDSQRAEYIQTLPQTYKFPDNVLQRLDRRRVLVKRYYNQENGKYLYDFGVKSDDGALISKFAREGRSGEGYLKNLETGQARIGTNGTTSRTGQMESASVPAGQRSNNINNIGEFVNKNDFIKKEIGKIRNDTTWDKTIRNAPDTDFRVLDAVKKNIDDQIEVAKRAGENDKVMRLQIQKNGLVNAMDAVVPEYKTARQVYEIKGKVLAAQKIGEKSLDGKVTAETLGRKMREMSPAERQAMGIGMKENILSNLGSKENESLAFRQLLNQNNQDKLRLVLGRKQAKTIIDYAQDEVSAFRNFNEATKGSQTAKRLKDVENEEKNIVIDFLKNPVGFLGTLADYATAPSRNATNKAIIELLTEKGGTKLSNALERKTAQEANNELLARLLAASAGTGGANFN